MATPAYTTTLVDIITDMPSVTGWTLISSGGGGQNAITAPETDDFIQGISSVSRNPWSGAIRGMMYNSTQNFSVAGTAMFIWWKADIAQALNTKALGGVQVLIGSSLTDFKCYYVEGKDTYEIGGWRCSVVDPTFTPSATVGSPTTTRSYFGVRWDVPGSGPSKGFPFKIDAIRRGNSATVSAGDVADPATWTKLGTYSSDINRRWGLSTPTNTGVQQQGIVNWGAAFGGGEVYSRDLNRVITLLETNGFVSTSFTGIVIQNAATDVEWDNITVQALGTLNRGGISILNNAKAWLTNCNFVDTNTFAGGGTNTKVDGTTFRRTNQVTANGGSFLGTKFIAPTVAVNTSVLNWITTANPNTKLDGASFTKGTAAHHAIEFGVSSPTTMTLTGISFSGFNASNAQNDSTLHIKRTTGTVTINLIGCSGNISYRTDGATVVLILDPKQFNFSLSPAITGYEWRLYYVTAIGSLAGSVEKAGEESAGVSSQSYSYTYTAPQAMALQIISQPGNDYEEKIQYFTLGNNTQNVVINLIKDNNN